MLEVIPLLTLIHDCGSSLAWLSSVSHDTERVRAGTHLTAIKPLFRLRRRPLRSPEVVWPSAIYFPLSGTAP